jgi:Uma2 family endonuclease
MTPEEYLALPEEKPYLEYVDGVVLQKPMPNREHVELVAEIIFRIKIWIQTHGGRTGPEARAQLGELQNYRLPDVSFWKAGEPRDDDTRPSLAVEVRSRSQTLAELRRKCDFLRSSGVETCWLIDPISKTAELYQGRRKAGLDVSMLTANCLPGFELALTDLFAVLDDSKD